MASPFESYFDPVRIRNYHSIYDDKIDHGETLSDEEKIALGKELSPIENVSKVWRMSSYFYNTLKLNPNQYYRDRAERYITYRQINKLFDQSESTSSSEENEPLTSSISRAQTAKSKALTPEKSELEEQKRIMYSILGIDLLPDVDNKLYIDFYKDMQAKKRELLNLSKIPRKEDFDLSQAKVIFEQNREYPLVNTIINEIKLCYEKLDDLELQKDNKNGDFLTQNIKYRLSNLCNLSKYIQTLSPQDQMTLKQLTSNLARRNHEIYLFIQGKLTLFEAPEKKAFIEAMQIQLDNIKLKLSQHVPDDPIPISAEDILAHTQLQEAKKKAKMWAGEKSKIAPLGVSANMVFKLMDPNVAVNSPSAYFKIGSQDEEGAGLMEKLVWDIAVWMGASSSFVPTGTERIRVKDDYVGGTEITHKWTKTGDIEKIMTARHSKMGGIQPAQKGLTLHEYEIQSILPLASNEIIQATTISLAFGMFDTHGGNIFVTDEGKIKFFDNTRSLPHSNYVINWGLNLLPTFRSALLTLSPAQTPLTPKQKNEIKKQIDEFHKKMETLEDYLLGPQAQQVIKKLPPGWFNVNDVLSAMRERIDLMKSAIDNPNVKSLVDFAAESIPGYKFCFALTLLGVDIFNPYSQNKIAIQSVHEYVSQRIDDYIERFAGVGFDIPLIKQWCDNKSTSLNDIVRLLKNHYNDLISHPLNSQERLKRIANGKTVLEELTKIGKFDFKDINREYCNYYIKSINLKKLNEQYTINEYKNFQDAKDALLKSNENSLLAKSGNHYHLLLRDPKNNISRHTIDLTSKIGHIQFPRDPTLSPVPIPYIKDWVRLVLTTE